MVITKVAQAAVASGEKEGPQREQIYTTQAELELLLLQHVNWGVVGGMDRFCCMVLTQSPSHPVTLVAWAVQML